MNSFIDEIVSHKMEDWGHEIISAEPENGSPPYVLSYFQQYELYGCKKCGYIFGIDKTQQIFVLGFVDEMVEKGVIRSFNYATIKTYDENITCEDLIVRSIIE